MQTFTRTMIGTVAAGAMAVSAATPALARDGHGGIDAGDVIAGALVIGGIAAIASAAGKSNRDADRYTDDWNRRPGDRYGDYDYRRGLNSHEAVEQCIAAATHRANRRSYGGRARVTDIRDVDHKRYGYKVEGRIAVNTMGRNWRYGDRERGYGWNRDYRGWNDGMRGYDSGRFACKIDHRGRVMELRFSGIRGL